MSNHAHNAPFMQPTGPMYPHAAPHMPHHAHGFCRTCCHPVAQCACHRQCRKIEKELLVQPQAATKPVGTINATTGAGANLTEEAAHLRINAMMDLTNPEEAAESDEKADETRMLAGNIQRLRLAVSRKRVAVGLNAAVIGGGCCVHISLEYMPLTPLVDMPAFSCAMVIDSQSTVMLWGKYFVGDGYHVKECVISTNPGAYLWVSSINSVTRARWCEIISC